MKKADIFNPGQWLIENKLTNQSKLDEIKINNPDKQVNFKSIEVDGDDPSDYPDFSDAYIAYAEYEDGTPLTDAELEQFQEEHPDLAAEMALDKF